MAVRNDFGYFKDDDLRARFAKLRAEEEAQAPQFSVIAAQARRSGQRSSFAGKLIAATACVAIIVVAVLWRQLSPHRQRYSGQPVASLTQWKAPTDFLLQTPGRELLQTVPTIGTVQDFAGASPLTHDHRQEKKQVSP